MHRANRFAVSPEGAPAPGVPHHHVVNDTRLPSTPGHLVFLRVEGASVEQAALVSAWREAGHLFTEQERTALAWPARRTWWT